MAQETTTAPPGADNPQEKRTCTKCSAERVVSPETWPYRKGREGRYQAHGGRCLECEKKRKAEYEERRDSIASHLLTPTDAPGKGKASDKGKALTEASKLDVAKALKAGSLALNSVAPSVMARILEYLEDPESPHHIWALELLAQRILPRKLYEELGGQAAGVGALNDRRPQFVVNILPAQLGASGNVYEHDAVPQLAAPVPEEAADPFS